MGIKKNADGTYRVSYSQRHPITRQAKSLSRYRNDKGLPITNMAEAKRIRDDLLRQLNDQLKRSVCPTWKKACEDVIAYKIGTTEWTFKTASNYEVCLRSYTYERWGERLVDDFHPQEIRNLILEEMKDNSISHQKNVLKYIKAVFTYCSDNGFIKGSPVPTIKFKSSNKLTAVLTPIQIEKFLNTAKELEHHWYPVWALACYTGMRSGELYALSWEQVDLDRRKIKVDRAWNSKDGFKSTKSGHDRWVEIAPYLIPVLAELKLKNDDSQFVLPRSQDWDRGEQARILRAFLLGLELPRVRFHDLRASWATIMLGRGIEAAKVMKMGGWSDLKTMERYLRLSGIETKGIVDELELHNPSREAGELIELSMRVKKS